MTENSKLPQNTVEDHMPTVRIKSDGTLEYTTDEINTERRGKKIIKVLPEHGERVVSLKEHSQHFQNLEFADILLTNACNLSCTYCYEQHNRDYGRFTPDSIRQVWDWLRDINDYFPKYIQFFGGEPLIHSKLILDFMRENKDELERMKDKMAVSITTNGLLLTPEFIDEFFSYPNVKMMISLDTVNATLDHRGIPQLKIDHLLDSIEHVARVCKHPDNLAIRATISRENSPYLKELWQTVYDRGVRQLIFHPLILSLGQGYINWPEEEWQQFRGDILDIMRTHPDIEHFQVAEGVGAKGKTNCMVGSDEIAVDASGDFSGCYFFTNRKGDAASTMLLGNIMDDELYIDRYEGFKASYEGMYDENPECATCDVKNLCYQCPAGNMATSGKLYRADGMCKRIIELYSDCNEQMMENKLVRKLKTMIESRETEGDAVLSRALIHLMSYYFEDVRPDTDDVIKLVTDTGVEYKNLLGYFRSMIDYANQPDTTKEDVFTPEFIVNEAIKLAETEGAKVVYQKVMEGEGLEMTRYPTGETDEDVLFITLMHFVIFNTSESRHLQ